MKEKVISIQQIKEAKRLHRALEITGDGSPIITLSEMFDKVVAMDRQTEHEHLDTQPKRQPRKSRKHS